MSVPVAAEKACTRCGEVKNLAEFYRHLLEVAKREVGL